MNDSKTIQYNRNIMNKLNLIYSLIPKRIVNTDSNIPSIKERKTYSYRDFKPIKIKTTNNINNILSINNSSLTSFNKSNISDNYFFKTLKKEGKKLYFSCKKYKKYQDSPKQNKSEKIPLKILNEFFKPDIKKIKNKNKKFEIMHKKIFRKQNCSMQTNKINTSNNNLSYYFPNLFNVPYNKISSPDKHLNTSRFFFKNLKELKYDENVKNFTLVRKNNNSHENDNLSKSKFNNESNEPIFIEKEYSLNVLKHLRFNFKNLVEKESIKISLILFILQKI